MSEENFADEVQDAPPVAPAAPSEGVTRLTLRLLAQFDAAELPAASVDIVADIVLNGFRKWLIDPANKGMGGIAPEVIAAFFDARAVELRKQFLVEIEHGFAIWQSASAANGAVAN
jgi:hypothetical protein